MQLGPKCEREAFIRDLLGDHVLEQVRLGLLPLGDDEIEAPQHTQVVAHLVQRAELGVDGGNLVPGTTGRGRSPP